MVEIYKSDLISRSRASLPKTRPDFRAFFDRPLENRQGKDSNEAPWVDPRRFRETRPHSEFGMSRARLPRFGRTIVSLIAIRKYIPDTYSEQVNRSQR